MPLAWVLWFLLGLFVLRVSGQLLVALGWIGFLPPMEAWHSGLLPYPGLLLCQILILTLYTKVCIDFTRGRGYFVVPRRGLGGGLLIFGSLYFASMGVRHIIQGPSIPVYFHWVLAAFILAVGRYHWTAEPKGQK